MMTIGQLAKAAGTSVETIRFYEKRGLLPAPDRLPSGYRVYRNFSVRQIHFIQEAQALGFRLSEIAELMALTADPGADCSIINARTREKTIEIESKIDNLTKVREKLGYLLTCCPNDNLPIGDCGIVHYLYGADIRESDNNK